MENKKYKYQMHTHTSPCSRCGAMTPEKLALGLHESGYAGAVLTNHFMGGNSGIDRSLPWSEFVRAYEDDYIACREAAKRYGVDIIFSVEEHLYGGIEILAYGITPNELYSHPELAERKPEDWQKILHGCGGVLIQAHPYRERSYITQPGPLPYELLDGIEVYNYGNTPEANERAAEFAKAHPELILTSGADAHTKKTIPFGGIESSVRIRNEKELVEVLKSGKYELIF